jgi:hypothetical protein
LSFAAGARPGLTRAVLRVTEGPQYLVNRLSWNRQAVLDSEQMNRLRARVTVRPGAPYPAHLPAALWDDVMGFLRAEDIEASVRLRSYLSADSSPLRPRIDLLISIETEPAPATVIAPWLPFAPVALPY